MAGFRAKQTEIWHLGILVTHICGVTLTLVFKVIWGSFGAFVSKWPVTQNGWSYSETERNLRLEDKSDTYMYGVHLTL